MGGRAGQGRPRLYLSLVLSLVRLYIFVFLGTRAEVPFCFSFVFPTGGWGPDYDQLGRYWCQGKGHMHKQLLPVL